MAAEHADIDALFQLPVNEFIPARDALAARLKAAGRVEAGSRVKALAKPPLSAWAVNQLYWRHRKAFDQLLAAGERLRRAQATTLRSAGGKGAGLRGVMEARRGALAALSTRAGSLLEEAGHASSPELTRRITATLDALATYGGMPDGPRPGRLTGDVEAPGIESLAALVGRRARRGTGPTRVIPFAQRRETGREGKPRDPEAERRRRAAEERAQRAAVRAAERALGEARRTAARAEAALRRAAGGAVAAERKRAALAVRFDKVTAEAERARQRARRVAAKAEEAAQAVADAERALEDARRERGARG
ncbi:MAG: hypothetical protein A3J29_22990 [Acidobacteria bacterium RIFCSPLOWO2_12_FULL_67_14b]|nr:MAG: hypothetical protein A3I61_13610 [Acidobacteria bacterium RIFCSPLOWO2_02_FULL_68_18]OFW45377.1 MAG: hypothetical protein A3J29_22990 [Acidobacteria bacterium RIFCSPLOWO2_12_FULL_67_14b]